MALQRNPARCQHHGQYVEVGKGGEGQTYEHNKTSAKRHDLCAYTKFSRGHFSRCAENTAGKSDAEGARRVEDGRQIFL